MEDGKKTNEEKVISNKPDEIIKPIEQQTDQHEQDNQLQQKNLQQQEPQEQEENENQIETPGEKQQLQTEKPQEIEYEDDEDDDDEEKDTSQKLVIDIPEEEEEEEKDEEDDDVVAIEELQPELSAKKECEKISAKPEIDAIITLSDGEEDCAANEAISKPGKVQKRRSVGAGSANEEEHFRLKRRKINVAGAPKLPLTGYVRYMNDRRESLRKEHPSKTHMEHNKMIGEEWHSLPADVKSSYLKAADVDKQRLF